MRCSRPTLNTCPNSLMDKRASEIPSGIRQGFALCTQFNPSITGLLIGVYICCHEGALSSPIPIASDISWALPLSLRYRATCIYWTSAYGGLIASASSSTRLLHNCLNLYIAPQNKMSGGKEKDIWSMISWPYVQNFILLSPNLAARFYLR